MTRVEKIRAALQRALPGASIAIEDESHKHAGHAGAATGRGHFRVEIVTESFAGEAPLARHRRVYEALADLMQTDIHALSLRARTPAELAAAPADRTAS